MLNSITNMGKKTKKKAAPPPPPHLALGVLDARLQHFFPWPLQSVLLSTRRWRCGSSANAGCALSWGRCTQGERWLLAGTSAAGAPRR
mmetsp:Transcript_5264/g.12654  ORF Transcript_5264/g.12654 Transcript_5264/m.12654 type:complete len:88 (+) Transcript_5264:185-448(+)